MPETHESITLSSSILQILYQRSVAGPSRRGIWRIHRTVSAQSSQNVAAGLHTDICRYHIRPMSFIHRDFLRYKRFWRSWSLRHIGLSHRKMVARASGSFSGYPPNPGAVSARLHAPWTTVACPATLGLQAPNWSSSEASANALKSPWLFDWLYGEQ